MGKEAANIAASGLDLLPSSFWLATAGANRARTNIEPDHAVARQIRAPAFSK